MTGRVISGFSPPEHRVLKYDDVLPNIGFVYDITPQISAFANYSKGLSVPSTDNLYNAFFFPEGTDAGEAESGNHGQLRRRRPLSQHEDPGAGSVCGTPSSRIARPRPTIRS